ncbi:hypothetical protein D3C72_1247980 [compost metagenome]
MARSRFCCGASRPSCVARDASAAWMRGLSVSTLPAVPARSRLAISVAIALRASIGWRASASAARSSSSSSRDSGASAAFKAASVGARLKRKSWRSAVPRPAASSRQPSMCTRRLPPMRTRLAPGPAGPTQSTRESRRSAHWEKAREPGWPRREIIRSTRDTDAKLSRPKLRSSSIRRLAGPQPCSMRRTRGPLMTRSSSSLCSPGVRHRQMSSRSWPISVRSALSSVGKSPAGPTVTQQPPPCVRRHKASSACCTVYACSASRSAQPLGS